MNGRSPFFEAAEGPLQIYDLLALGDQTGRAVDPSQVHHVEPVHAGRKEICLDLCV